ncbi:hypothetical protein BD413DRAFT_547077 [Trametes elegans]|nr:hypothetical protein BD413DRAFT_547077 [Trametes elegans]
MATSSLIAVVVSLSALLNGSLAQGTDAVCLTGYEWMSNSKGQSPCLVSSYLLSPCVTTAAASYVSPLLYGYHYNSPQNNPSSATPCRCSTVFYSTISACATCQGQGSFILPWSTYSTNCSTVYSRQYPDDIPGGTAVPAWAYIDVIANDTFNPVVARAVAEQGIDHSLCICPRAQTHRNQGAIESTATSNGPTATSLASAPGVSQTAAGAPQSPDGNNTDGSPSSSKSSTDIGAIVGGAVGGVVGVVGIGLAVFFWLRRKRNAAHNAPTGPVDLVGGENGQYVEKAAETDAFVAPLPSPKVYDPNDPSTFPSNFDAQADASRSSAIYPSPTQAHFPAIPYAYPVATASEPTTGTNPTYRGAPEL